MSDDRNPTDHNHTLSDITDAGTAAAAATGDFAAHDHNHNSTYLGITAQAADSDMLDGQHGADFAAADHGHTASDVTDGTFADARISAGSVTQHQASIDHDALTNFVANEHIDWTADQGTTNIHTGNYNNTEYSAGSGLSLSGTEFAYDNSVIASQVDLSNTSALHLSISSNLSDLNNAGTARSNLGLGSAAQSATTDFASSGHTHAAATTSANGFMSSTDKTKLDAYPSTPSSVGKYSDFVTLKFDSSGVLYDRHADYTFEHGLGTQNIVVAMWAHPISTTGYTVADRFNGVAANGFTVYPGQHLDIGYDVLVISCDANGDIDDDYVTFDFTNWSANENNVYSKYLYFTVIG